ncbi:hypothetical protein KIV64_gp19 [Mycobacterium phage DroogsArmy]|uniref:Uncharacterized protein n=1 Tax=Mycobacterium phage DroogsArmy TaxID=2744011 RepID=A0A6N0A737_9CAUD|nr:hypothetical protein KIV64_gp19 [Mycobacterium phage DroogsArmy]QKO02469.1 hypothetical protein SEA_DROOGSARMY_73 [Mycobacterium phage DroogsArmy]
MATKLVHAETVDTVLLDGWIATLEQSLKEARERQAEAKRPLEPAGKDVVIRFRKYDRRYSFAALKVVGIGYPKWFLTQDGTRSSRQGKAPMVWSDLLDFIGERNWDTIEVLS